MRDETVVDHTHRPGHRRYELPVLNNRIGDHRVFTVVCEGAGRNPRRRVRRRFHHSVRDVQVRHRILQERLCGGSFERHRIRRCVLQHFLPAHHLTDAGVLCI